MSDFSSMHSHDFANLADLQELSIRIRKAIGPPEPGDLLWQFLVSTLGPDDQKRSRFTFDCESRFRRFDSGHLRSLFRKDHGTLSRSQIDGHLRG